MGKKAFFLYKYFYLYCFKSYLIIIVVYILQANCKKVRCNNIKLDLALLYNCRAHDCVYNLFFKIIKGSQVSSCFFIRSLVYMKYNIYMVVFSSI